MVIEKNKSILISIQYFLSRKKYHRVVKTGRKHRHYDILKGKRLKFLLKFLNERFGLDKTSKKIPLPLAKRKKTEVIPKLIYAIGDIHGCERSSKKLMKKISPQNSDTVVFLGDYIDRGPNSKGVIEFLIDFSKTHPNTVFLKGNHEWMFYEFYKNRDPDMWNLWEINGARSTLKSYGNIENIPKEHVEFIKKTKTYYIQDEYFFVHAGVKPGKPLKEQKNEDMLWIRYEFIHSDNPLESYIVVFGHTPMEKPLIMSDKIGIDTGCVYGGYLTCIRLNDRKIFQERC